MPRSPSRAITVPSLCVTSLEARAMIPSSRLEQPEKIGTLARLFATLGAATWCSSSVLVRSGSFLVLGRAVRPAGHAILSRSDPGARTARMPA